MVAGGGAGWSDKRAVTLESFCTCTRLHTMLICYSLLFMTPDNVRSFSRYFPNGIVFMKLLFSRRHCISLALIFNFSVVEAHKENIAL